MTRKSVVKAAVAAALALGAGVSPAFALALRSAAASVGVAGLAPGRACRLSECAKTRLSLLNTGQETASVTLSVDKPSAADLADGYEPAASASWVRLDSGGWSLAPGKIGQTDAVVTVPGGTARPGQYQVDWLAEGRSAGGFRLKLRGRLLLRVGDGDEDEWRRERERSDRRQDALLELLAPKRAGRPAPLGRRVALRDLGAALKAANPGERSQEVRVRAEAPERELVPAGYEPCPAPEFVKGPRRVTVGAGAVVELPLELEVPDEPRYRGRRWAFEVTAQALESPKDEPETVLILVDTEGAAAR